MTQTQRTTTNHCSACNAGYYLSGTGCKAYTCSTGTYSGCRSCMTQTQRTTTNHCSACNAGYYLSATGCKIAPTPVPTPPPTPVPTPNPTPKSAPWYYLASGGGTPVQCAGPNKLRCASDDGVSCKWGTYGEHSMYEVMSGVSASQPKEVSCPGWTPDNGQDACAQLNCYYSVGQVTPPPTPSPPPGIQVTPP